MVDVDQDDGYRLTELGLLAGEAGVEVETVARMVDALGPLSPDAISDPTLIAATQLTLDAEAITQLDTASA